MYSDIHKVGRTVSQVLNQMTLPQWKSRKIKTGFDVPEFMDSVNYCVHHIW
jgi:hypothetical protein